MNVRATIRRIRRRIREGVDVFDAVAYWRQCWGLYHVALRKMENVAAEITPVEDDPPPFPADLKPRYLRMPDDKRVELEQEIARRIGGMAEGRWVDVAEMFRVVLPPRPKLKVIPDHPRWNPPPPRPRPPGLPDRVWCNDANEFAKLMETVTVGAPM